MMEDSLDLLKQALAKLHEIDSLLSNLSNEKQFTVMGFGPELMEGRSHVRCAIRVFSVLQRGVDYKVNYTVVKQDLHRLIDVLDAESLRKVRDFVNGGITKDGR